MQANLKCMEKGPRPEPWETPALPGCVTESPTGRLRGNIRGAGGSPGKHGVTDIKVGECFKVLVVNGLNTAGHQLRKEKHLLDLIIGNRQ